MEESILIFGGNGFLAKAFNEKYKDAYDIQNVYRNDSSQQLNFDFENDDAKLFTDKLKAKYKAILFFQGINPSDSAQQMTEEHFIKMLRINLITPSILIQNLAEKINDGALVLFVSSVAKKKGSYDPAYASAKAGLVGLMHSLGNAYPNIRFNIISLGLVENSPVFNNMTEDFRQKHADRMINKSFVKVDDVINVVADLVNNTNVNKTDIEIDGGYN